MLIALPRLRRAGLIAVILAAAALGAAASLLFRSPAPVSVSWTGWLNRGLEDYADTAGQWNSGDNAVQVALPGGRALWLFNDSYYGPEFYSVTLPASTSAVGGPRALPPPRLHPFRRPPPSARSWRGGSCAGP